MTKVLIVSKFLPLYRLAVFNRLSSFKEIEFLIVAPPLGEKEGIKMIPKDMAFVPIKNGGIRWLFSTSIFYHKSLQLWQTNVVNKIIAKEFKIVVLEGAVSHLSTWVFTLLCYVFNKKVIYWSQGLKGHDKGLKKHLRLFFFKYLPHANFVYGDFQKNVMLEHGIPNEKIFVIGNSLNFEVQNQIRDQIELNSKLLIQSKFELFIEDFPTIIFVGRLEPNKKVDLLLIAISNLKKVGQFYNCIILGSGSDSIALFELSQSLNLESQVKFLGEIYQEEIIAKYFCLSDLMVSPGNVGLNCLHALAYGVPVLTHDNFIFQGPEVESIVSGKNGILYKWGDSVDLENKITEWFKLEKKEILKECLEPLRTTFNPEVHARRISLGIKFLDNQY